MKEKSEYLHGGDIYHNPVSLDFSVNSNPLGMPRRSIGEAVRGVKLSGQYPDYRGEDLCRELAVWEKVHAENVLLGNGAAELIYALCVAVKPKKCLTLAPTFQEYARAVQAMGGQTEFVNLRERDCFRTPDSILAAIEEDTDIVFICNPNNPTGQMTEQSLLFRIAAKCEATGTWLCVDEGFLPFLPDEENYSMKRMMGRFSRLIVLRAFTKLFGMPGMRLGYMLSGNSTILSAVRSSMQPWNTSLPAQLAGIAALQDKEYVEKTRLLIARERTYLCDALRNGLADKVYPTYANFILFQARPDLAKRLQEEGILIRSCGNFRNLSNRYFRIAVRTRKDNRRLIEAWRKVYGITDIV